MKKSRSYTGRSFKGADLCEDHAASHGVKEGTYNKVPSAFEQAPEEFVKCEQCAMVIMRRCGAI